MHKFDLHLLTSPDQNEVTKLSTQSCQVRQTVPAVPSKRLPLHHRQSCPGLPPLTTTRSGRSSADAAVESWLLHTDKSSSLLAKLPVNKAKIASKLMKGQATPHTGKLANLRVWQRSLQLQRAYTLAWEGEAAFQTMWRGEIA